MLGKSLLEYSDVLGFGASMILFHLKAHSITFSKYLESRHIDAREMYKYVPTIVVSDEIDLRFLFDY